MLAEAVYRTAPGVSGSSQQGAEATAILELANLAGAGTKVVGGTKVDTTDEPTAAKGPNQIKEVGELPLAGLPAPVGGGTRVEGQPTRLSPQDEVACYLGVACPGGCSLSLISFFSGGFQRGPKVKCRGCRWTYCAFCVLEGWLKSGSAQELADAA